MRTLQQRQPGRERPQRGCRSKTRQEKGGRREGAQETTRPQEGGRGRADEQQRRRHREHLGHADGMNLIMKAYRGEVEDRQPEAPSPPENEDRSERRGAAQGERARAASHRRSGSPLLPLS